MSNSRAPRDLSPTSARPAKRSYSARWRPSLSRYFIAVVTSWPFHNAHWNLPQTWSSWASAAIRRNAGSTSRARSLRNLLVSGNECGRVFPAGVGPGSPSRDAANWLPSRFSLSVETRRRYGWLRMMVFPGARLFPSPNLVPFGRVAARERQGALSRRAL